MTGVDVVAAVDIMSDDRSLGQNDGSPVVPAGSKGVIIRKSKDSEDGNALKDDKCYIVKWLYGDGETCHFDTRIDEMTLECF